MKPKKGTSQSEAKLRSEAEIKEQRERETTTTRGVEDGRTYDYIRHKVCGGNGCGQCGNLGFAKQLVNI